MREHSLAALLMAMTVSLVSSSVVADDKAEKTGVRLTVAVAPVPRENAVPGHPLGVMVTGVGLPAAGAWAIRREFAEVISSLGLMAMTSMCRTISEGI